MPTRNYVLQKKAVSLTETQQSPTAHSQLSREYIVPMVAKAVAILELLRTNPIGLTIEQIHNHTGVARSSIYRIVRTLVWTNYLVHEENGTYAPSYPLAIQKVGRKARLKGN